MYIMTYKRKSTITRLSNLKISHRGRNSSQDSTNEDNPLASLAGEPGRPVAGDASLPPSCSSPPPPPQLSASLPSTSFAAPPPAPPPSPPLAVNPTLPEKTTLWLRMEILHRNAQEDPATTAPTKTNTFITVALSHLNTLMARQKCPVETCRSSLKVSIHGGTLLLTPSLTSD